MYELRRTKLSEVKRKETVVLRSTEVLIPVVGSGAIGISFLGYKDPNASAKDGKEEWRKRKEGRRKRRKGL